MADKPQMKREVGIAWDLESKGIINFYATNDALEDIKGFGMVLVDSIEGRLTLIVDSRYDFKEVKHYIETYGEQDGQG